MPTGVYYVFKGQADWLYFGQSKVQSRPVARQILIVEALYQVRTSLVETGVAIAGLREGFLRR